MRIVSCVWIHETFDVLGIQDLANLSLTNGAQSVATDLCLLKGIVLEVLL
ncbi:MAG TPA: hypothetical protein VJJ21_04060 [Candidatus Nanoarchaeia archaeon]|nr:hypothetical protein [Candidatus Nanoarchaeia archaeon]